MVTSACYQRWPSKHSHEYARNILRGRRSSWPTLKIRRSVATVFCGVFGELPFVPDSAIHVNYQKRSLRESGRHAKSS